MIARSTVAVCLALSGATRSLGSQLRSSALALMAGSPVKRRLGIELEQRTRSEYPDEPEATALDYVARWQAGGRTLRALAHELSVSAPMLSEYLRAKHGAAETKATLTRAREDGAHSLADKVLEIADSATEDTIQVSRLQVSATQWVAEKWNPAELGPRPANASVTVNIGSLMLAALMQPAPLAPVAIARVIVPDEQTISIEDSSTYEVERSTDDRVSEGEGTSDATSAADVEPAADAAGLEKYF